MMWKPIKKLRINFAKKFHERNKSHRIKHRTIQMYYDYINCKDISHYKTKCVEIDSGKIHYNLKDLSIMSLVSEGLRCIKKGKKYIIKVIN